MSNLVIVESPTKARTISRFLPRDFTVASSFGHIRDLPARELGVDVANDFAPKYVIPPKSRKTIKELKGKASKAKKVILATDEDREGEAIAWHLVQALGLDNRPEKSELTRMPRIKNSDEGIRKVRTTSDHSDEFVTSDRVQRIVFHEITKRAIEEALEHPRDIDVNLVDAQQARRVLDRLVGYELSPFLWRKVARGLSAGRVQSVAVRLVTEREREIENFKPQEYWTVEAELKTKEGETFIAKLHKIDERILEKLAIKTKADAEKIVQDLEGAEWQVAHIERKELSRNPFPPFTTSTLQQDAWRRLKFSAAETMRLAQELYEGVELGAEGSVGLITYMRTDSVNLSKDSLFAAKNFIKNAFGEEYALPAPRTYKTKTKGAQEAHEAIRPTDPSRTPESIKQYLNPRQAKLYELIWRRFLATQMASAKFDATTIDVNAGNYTFRATGSVKKFDGFLKVYPIKTEDALLPVLEIGEPLTLEKLTPNQHFTEPPPRFSEATLVKALEEYGIGRPSTYAPILSTIQERRYVEKDEKKQLVPTEMGKLVNDLLVEHFPQVVDIQFTAKMEEELDEIAEGKTPWQPVVKAFYEPFKENLTQKYAEIKKRDVATTPTEEMCDVCGRPMVIRTGRFGRFLACTGYPECKNTKNLNENHTEIPCPKCKEGHLVEKRTKRRKIFHGCSRYPECDFAVWGKPTGEKCPECGSLLVPQSKTSVRCSKCEYRSKLS